MNTSTVFGFALALEDVLRKENPSHVAVVFDPPGPTFRKDLYDSYKSNREETPEDIKISVPLIKKLIEGLNIPIIEVEGFEADDVIGTMAKAAEKEGYTVYMMTPDKDYAQLVSDNIFMFKPARGGGSPEIWGTEEVRQKFHVEHPEQVIDILALWGDSSDNIPGAPGIGEKTAKKLIGRYKSVEELYRHMDDLKGKQRENLENFHDQVLLSRELATIALDVPVNVDIRELKRGEMNVDELKRLFNELEFKTLAKRILNEEAESSPAVSSDGQGSLFGNDQAPVTGDPADTFRTLETTDHEYHLITDIRGVKALANELETCEEFCFDTETTGLDPVRARLVGLAISREPHRGSYIAFHEDEKEIAAWLRELEPVFRNKKIRKIGQNLKYDLHILSNYSVTVNGTLFDTMIAHFILHPDRRHNLDAMAEEYLHYSMVKIESLIGKKGSNQKNFRSVPPEIAREYACEDADITYQLYQELKEPIRKEGFEKLFETIEMPLVPVLMEMEHQGVKLDVQALDAFAEELRTELIEVEKQIYELCGSEFNISSPKQLGEILFDRLKIISDPRKTKTKQYSTSEEVLEQLTDKHPAVSKVLEYRSLKKLLSTYVEALPRLVNPETGRVHTSYNQALVATGRLSSNNPNLQNIPIREERGREIRRAFIPVDTDHAFLSADYSQIELRLMAHMSGDEQMIRAFQDHEDIHASTAAKIYGLEPEEVTREMRSRAKTANFGIIYGISAFGLSQRMRIPRSEARELIDGYFRTYPRVRKFMDECIKSAREKGYVETLYGRKRYLKDILSRNSVVRGNAERNAINTPIQGSAADVIKIAMVRIHEELKKAGCRTKMILQVHDELIFDVWPGELKQVEKIVREQMEQAAKLKVPLIVDIGSGANWLEAH